jgi:rare lipoprotein A
VKAFGMPSGPGTPTTEGKASWYGNELAGHLMANGKPFNPNKLTCASWNYPLGTVLKVQHKKRTVVVSVTDRGPAKRLNRQIDLSQAAFAKLAPLSLGLIQVSMEPFPR